MKIIFRVSKDPVLIVYLSKNGGSIVKMDVLNPLLARNAFPKAFEKPPLPPIGDLAKLLRIYANEENKSIKELATLNGERIPFIEFKQNLNVVFEKDEGDV